MTQDPAPRRSLVVGLTGGIGSGKSAAAAEFARLGATIVDADAIAHELTAKGGAAMAQVRKLFGGRAVDREGAMDRTTIRDIVFADPKARRALESLLHPMVRDESRRRIAAAAGPYVVYVVPLLVETAEARRQVDRVLVIDCPEEVQLERVRTRGLPDEQIRAILASQAARAQRLAAADDVIDNSGTLDALRKQVAEMHTRYLEVAKNVKG